MPTKILESVLIKPADPDYNLDCGYCFYLGKGDMFGVSSTHRMSIETLEETVRQVLTQGPARVSFGWQGGEPTLMGLPFFEKAVEFQKKYGMGQTVGNGLQTNGLLLDQRWAKFLGRYNFLVGVSLDGPEEVHDRYRKTKNGKGSAARVIEATRLLLETGVDTNVLSVINDYSGDFPEEIYSFHKSLGIRHMQFIPCVERDTDSLSETASFSVSADKYGRFLCAIFDLWREDFENGKPTTSIRYFDSLLYKYMRLGEPECTLKPTCGDYLVIEHNGEVYSCDFFVDPAWNLGNVGTERLIDMLNSDRQKMFGTQKEALSEQCIVCPWLANCNGGCVKDRVNNSRDSKLSPFCEAYRMFFEHADTLFVDLAHQLMFEQEQNKSRTARENRNRIHMDKVGRNQPCPCGSGKKFKKCCGRNTR